MEINQDIAYSRCWALKRGRCAHHKRVLIGSIVLKLFIVENTQLRLQG